MKINNLFENKYVKTFVVACVFLLLAVVLAIGGNVIVKNGELNVSDDLYVSNNVLYVDSSTGRVGIGKSDPGYKLDVNGTVNARLFQILVGSDLAQLYLIDGGDPQLYFNNDGYTRALALNPNGNWYFSNGNVGIGDTSPDAKLDVLNTGTGASFRVDDDADGDSTPFIIDANGSVGIGTNSPAGDMELFSQGSDATLYITSFGMDPSIIFSTQCVPNPCRKFVLGVDYSDSNKFKISMGQYLGSNTILTINDYGLVGIGTGTTNPLAQLHAVGNNIDGIKGESDGASGVLGESIYGTGVTGYGRDGTGGYFSSQSGNALITGTGKVGIGITNPVAKLHVVGNIIAQGAGDTRISITNTEAGGSAWSWANDWSGANGFSLIQEGVAGDRIFVRTNGNVGIGTTNPTSKLHVIGKGTFTGGVDPPYVSYSEETHESIRDYAKDVDEHEKVMMFWNGEAHRMEVYVISEDKFYTITGDLVEE